MFATTGSVGYPKANIAIVSLDSRYDYQIYYAHFCNRPCQHLSCARSIAHARRVPSGVAFTRRVARCVAFTRRVPRGIAFTDESSDRACCLAFACGKAQTENFRSQSSTCEPGARNARRARDGVG
jgi:hypothetical protein